MEKETKTDLISVCMLKMYLLDWIEASKGFLKASCTIASMLQ